MTAVSVVPTSLLEAMILITVVIRLIESHKGTVLFLIHIFIVGHIRWGTGRPYKIHLLRW